MMPTERITFEKILVVTKSIEFQQEIRRALTNYLVIAVETADQAVEKLKTTDDIAALLIGIYLPETKGFELLKYLKENQNFYTGPVLILTDAVNDKVIDDVKDYNIFDYIIRYSNEHLIRTTVRNAVVYYTEKSKLINYTVGQVFATFNDMKMLVAVLAQIIETKSSDTGPHTERVGRLTRILCKKLIEKYGDKYNLTAGDIYYISLASCLHDIGKIYIPDYILNKPGKLDSNEFEIMKAHSTLGAGIIDRLPNHNSRTLFKYAHDICLYHHERFDGAGYPRGLVGNETPIWAQIVSIADCYDALTSDRIYRKAMLPASAINMIEQGDCGMFNPDLLECFWECHDEIVETKVSPDTAKITQEAFNIIISDILKIK